MGVLITAIVLAVAQNNHGAALVAGILLGVLTVRDFSVADPG